MGRQVISADDFQLRAAALDVAIRALLAHSRAVVDSKPRESKAYRSVAKLLLRQRNQLIKTIKDRGGAYYTGSRLKLELET